MPDASDIELVERANQGDRQALELLVEKYYEVAVSAAYSVLSDFEAAKDCAQETFLEAAENLADLRNKDKFSQWVYGISRRKAIYVLRRRGLHNAALQAHNDRSRAIVRADSPPEQLRHEEKLESIRRSLAQIPALYREVLVLKYIDGRSHEEIGRVLNLSIAAVDKRLMRGKEMLRESLQRWRSDD